MSIISATATFSSRNVRVQDLAVMVKVYAGVRGTQALVRDEAKANCPVVTGALQSSIHETDPVDDGKRITGFVVADAAHASFVEFGTGLRGAGTYPGPLPQSGVPITGHWQYDYKNQGWVGMPAQPYMRPALDSVRNDAMDKFR